MRFASRVTDIVESPIAEAKAWLAQRPAGGRPLLDLSQAAPSYPTAPVIADRLAEVAGSADGAAYAPTFGLPALRAAIAAELSADHDADVLPTDVLPTAGCNQAFCVTVSALAGPGDEVIVVLPYYFNHDMWLKAEEIRPVYCAPGPDLVPEPDRIAALVTARTRAILLVTPGNPSGVTIPPQVIAAIADVAARNDVALIVDETYRNFRPVETPSHDLYHRDDWRDTAITLHSYSKDLAIPGHRVGAIVGGPAVVTETAKLLDCVAICTPRIGQEAVITGLAAAADWRRAQRERIATNLDHFRAAMAARPGGFELLTSGAFFGWVRHPATDTPTAEVVRRLVLDHDVLVIPGTAFQPTDDRFLRFSFANLDADEFPELASRLAEFAP